YEGQNQMSAQVRDRISRIEIKTAKLSTRPLGLSPGEIVACVAAFLFFAVAVFYYLTALKPLSDRLRSLETELAAQDREFKDLMKTPGGDAGATTTQNTAQEALDSLEEFNARHLAPLAKGRIALLNEINDLAKKNNVQLTSGIDMASESFKKDDQPAEAN